MDGLGGLDWQSRIEDFSHEIAGLLAQVLSELGPCTCRCYGMKRERGEINLTLGNPLKIFQIQ